MATQELLLLTKVMVKYVLHVLAELYSGQIQTTSMYTHSGYCLLHPTVLQERIWDTMSRLSVCLLKVTESVSWEVNITGFQTEHTFLCV